MFDVRGMVLFDWLVDVVQCSSLNGQDARRSLATELKKTCLQVFYFILFDDGQHAKTVCHEYATTSELSRTAMLPHTPN